MVPPDLPVSSLGNVYGQKYLFALQCCPAVQQGQQHRDDAAMLAECCCKSGMVFRRALLAHFVKFAACDITECINVLVASPG
jgi:hypothetical protein